MQTKILKEIGFNQPQIDVYLKILQLGEARASEIAQKTQIKRTTTYSILEELIKKGLLSKTLRRKVTYYVAEHPSKLKSQLEERLDRLSEITPQLEAVYNTGGSIPKIKFYEGVEGIKTVYSDTLDLPKGSEITGFMMKEGAEMIPDYFRWYVKQRLKKKIRTKLITNSGKELDKFLKRNKQELRNSKVVDEQEFPLRSEINIYGNKVFIASFGKERFGIIIESEDIATTLKSVFKMAWKE